MGSDMTNKQSSILSYMYPCFINQAICISSYQKFPFISKCAKEIMSFKKEVAPLYSFAFGVF